MISISKKLASYLKNEQYNDALSFIREEIAKYPTPEKKEFEVMVLYVSGKYDLAIESANKYLKNMHTNFSKINILGYLQLIFKDLEKPEEEKKYVDRIIKDYYRIYNNPKSKNWEKNRAGIFLIADLRMKGDLYDALKIARNMESYFMKNTKDKRAFIPIYAELSKIYSALVDELAGDPDNLLSG